MTLPVSGNPIKMSQVGVELGLSALGTLNIGNPLVRTLFGVATGPIKMSNGYGKSSVTQWGAAPSFNIRVLDNPNAYGTVNNDFFSGSATISPNAIAMSGDYVIVGAPQEDSGALAEQASAGKAYIFNVKTGALVRTLDNPNPVGGTWSYQEEFGRSVGISGNYAIVGAWREDEAVDYNGNFNSGKAYIFDVTTGTLVWTLNNPNAYANSPDDQFGGSVAISGNYAVVGARTDDVPPPPGGQGLGFGLNYGRAYIFNVTTGNLLFTLSNPAGVNPTLDDGLFGHDVAINDSYTVVGMGPNAAGNKAYVFSTTTGSLLWTLNDANAYGTATGDAFGTAVDVSGDYAIVGAYGEDDADGGDAGKAYIFNLLTGNLIWTIDNTNAYSTSAADNFGFSVAIGPGRAVVGARAEGPNSSGKAYIFATDSTYRFGSTWTNRTQMAAAIPSTNMSAITYFNSLFIVGGTTGRIGYSSDGINWTYVNTLVGQGWPSAYSIIMSFASSSSLCVLGGQTGDMATSTDGVTWTLRTQLKGTTWGANQINAIAYNGTNTWVAVGLSGRVATSTDGINWTYQAGLASTGWSTASIRDVIWDGTRFVIVGDSGKWATSTDGVTWTYQGVIIGASSVIWMKIVKSPVSGVYLVVGGNGSAASSTDGINWTDRSAIAASLTGSDAALSLIWDGSNFLIGFTTSKAVSVTPDATQWMKYSLPAGYSVGVPCLAKGGSVVVAAGNLCQSATSIAP